MRLTFLLDENILYHAIRGVDRYDKPDPTSAELIEAIARICHGIYVHQCLLDRYNNALKKLKDFPPRSNAAADFVKQLLHNNAKRGAVEQLALPALPERAKVPREDEEIVRAALIAKPIVVTHDLALRDAIMALPATLGLIAVDALGALKRARSEVP